ncbi:unnamed protein product [Triticum turgidum subsp. durum]|uniref:Uncharacterized protein n=1 Tax=Triticum turgidum subsp. durum TaxID=4567 RepID=A0A9R0TFY3_TRITD|nr:unnamed protein product [Triticum turgidum subsp. durum]
MHTPTPTITSTQAFIFLAIFSLTVLLNMASMGFSYAQVHVKQERLMRRISDIKKASATVTVDKSMTQEEEKMKERFMGEEEKATCNSWTAGRVHPCASSPAAAAPKGGHR